MSEIMQGKRSGLDVTLRPRRQLTLPREVCEALGLEVGDRLEISITDEGLLAKPKKQLALDALAEIQRVFQSSGLTEEDLQEEGRRVREQLSHAGYGKA
jgi:bifunctional DNA-binding transcriptional regulator/antitoxin component of YhaV-PrlF toxin-antitoxin module